MFVEDITKNGQNVRRKPVWRIRLELLVGFSHFLVVFIASLEARRRVNVNSQLWEPLAVFDNNLSPNLILVILRLTFPQKTKRPERC